MFCARRYSSAISIAAPLSLLVLSSTAAAEAPPQPFNQVPPDWSFLKPPKAFPIFKDKLLAKAEPDECFTAIGEPYPSIGKNGNCELGTSKTNEGYLWGLTQAGNKLWFGTGANIKCGYVGETRVTSLDPYLVKSWVCEYGESQYAKPGSELIPGVTPVNAEFGDWRPPNAYEYDLTTGKLTVRTPTDPNFTKTFGIRSAGSLGDLVFLAGPALPNFGGVNFFAFDGATGQLIESCNARAFNNIRQWRVINDSLYAGVGLTKGGGAIVRFNRVPEDPLAANDTCGLEVVTPRTETGVGQLGDAAYLTGADGRIAVSSWPGSEVADLDTVVFSRSKAGVWISSPIGENGLTIDDSWTQVWSPADYEPDLVARGNYGGGAIAYWKEALYFGTQHVDGTNFYVHSSGLCTNPAICYGLPQNIQESMDLLVNSNRASSIWRITNLANPTVELLYGEAELPKLTAPKTFTLASTGWTPLFGPSGFGNVFNNYLWTATVIGNSLLFGTMDWSYILHLLAGDLYGVRISFDRANYGADLWRFDDPSKSALLEDSGGAGNYLNYGIRSMVTSTDGKTVYIGTANAMNLEKKGGWELRQLKLKRSEHRMRVPERTDKQNRHFLLERTRSQGRGPSSD